MPVLSGRRVASGGVLSAAFVVVVASVVAGPGAWGAAPVGLGPQARANADCTVVGTAGGDVLVGTPGADVVCGLGGADVLRGRGGGDVLRGARGGDRLMGGGGGDRLRGGPGDDRLSGDGGDDSLEGRQGSDVLGGGPGVDLVTYDGKGARVSVTVGTGANDGRAGEGDDVRAGVERVRGTRFDDRLTGAVGGSTLLGRGGADVLRGRGGADRLFGQDGGDRLLAGAGDDELRGGDGPDRLDSRDARRFTDRVSCGGGGDTALADAGDRVDADCERLPGNSRPSDITLSSPSAPENSPVGTRVGRLSATDPDAPDTHTFALVAGAGDGGNGSFRVSGSRLLTDAVFDFETQESYPIRVRATDNRGASRTERFTVTVTDEAEDVAPVATDDATTVAEDAAATAVDVLANDTDVDGGPIGIDAVTQPDNGTVVITGGGAGLTYLPDADYCNDPPGTTPDTFTYTLTPGSSTATVEVTVTCVDDAPVAVDDTETVIEDAAATAVDVLANDTDADGDPPSIDSVTQPDNGTVVITGGGTGLTYLPDADHCNDPPGTSPDTFTYTLNGGSTAMVSVTVTCADDAPVAVDDSATLAEDDPSTAVDVLANDTDVEDDPISIDAVTQPDNGTVAITGGGTGLTYTPDANYCNDPPGTTPDIFTYTLNGSSTATVSITVTCEDDPPVAVDDTETVIEDDPTTAVDVLANDTDVDSGPIGIDAITQPDNGTVAVTGGGTGLTYTPDANYCNDPPGTTADTFTYTLNGGSVGTVSVTVTCVDDAPVATDDTAMVPEDSAPSPVDVLANDTDVEDDPINIDAVTQPDNGTVVITGGGTGLTYAPDANYCNDPPGTSPDTFTYTLNGGSTATVELMVTCGDDPPTAVDDTVTVDEDDPATAVDVLANDTDIDGGPITVGSVTQPDNGTVAITGGGTGLTYTPDANYCNDPPGTTADTFTYTLAPGGSTATVSVTVTCADDPPVAVDDTGTVAEDAAANPIPVLANDTDIDGGAISIGSVTQPDNGAVVITGGGTGLTYTLDANYCNDPPRTTPDTFTYTLAPGGSIADVAVAVTCVNDAPGFTAGPSQTNVANQNADGSARAYTINPWATGITAGPANEAGQTVDFVIDTVTPANLFTVAPAVSATGVLTFTTNPAISGTATITLHLHDNGGTANGGDDTSATQTFTIQTVVPPPVAVNDAYTATGNVGINVNTTAEGVLQRGTDDTPFGATITNCGATNATGTAVSGGTCTTASASGGSVVLNTNGTFTYNPPAGFTGADHFFYRLTNAGGTSVGDVTLTSSDMIWFVNNSAAACTTLAANCGRLANPFSSLAAFQALNTGTAPNPQPGHTVFVYTGGGNYLNGVTLRNSQLLIGQGAGASITTISGITLAPFSNTLPATGGTRPTFTTSAANTNAISLGTGNTIRGLNVANKTGSGISGTSFGTLTVNEMTISGTGRALNLTTGTANATFTSVSSTSGTNGIALTNVAGTLSFGTGGALTGSSGDVLLINGGANTYTYPGTITNTGTNRAVNISNRTGGTLTLSGQVTDTGGTGDGISLTNNTGATLNLTGGVQLTTGTIAAFTATGGGTVSVTGAANTLTTTTGTALTVTNTTIGATGLTFRAISSSGAPNGVVLNSTGSSGSLTVTGVGSNAQGGDFSGGTIQSTTGHGVALTNTLSPSFRNVRLLNTGDSGVNGTQVSGFSFVDGTITGAGDASDENSITFDDSLTTTANLTGAVTVTNNVISQTEAEGIDIQNFAGTISNATVSNNALSDTGDVATPGSAISVIAFGTPTTAASITRATIANNTITDFRAGAGVQVRAGNVNAGGPAGHAGIAGSATDVVAVTGNLMNGGSGGVGFQPDRFFTGGASGIGQGNFNISNNGTATNRIRNIDCIAIELQADGPATMTSTVQNNFINANSAVGCAGIAVGTDDPSDLGAGTHTTLISGNNVMGTDGPGIFPIIRDSGSTMIARVLNNTVAAPITTNAARAGIRVDSGSAQGDTTMCLEISGNTTAGSTNTATTTTSPGINIRKQGTDPAINTFGIEGLTPSPTGTPNVENWVNSQNTSTSGTFGIAGTALLSAQSGFTSCNAP